MVTSKALALPAFVAACVGAATMSGGVTASGIQSSPPSTVPDTAVAETPSIPLSVDVIVETARVLFAPSRDVLAPLAAFGIVPPKGVPAPAGAFVIGFSVVVEHPPGGGSFRARIDFAASVPATEVISFYEAETRRDRPPKRDSAPWRRLRRPRGRDRQARRSRSTDRHCRTSRRRVNVCVR